MKKQKLMNSLVKLFSRNPLRLGNLLLLFLLVGFTSPAFSQDVNPCGSIQVIGTSEGNSDSPPDGAVFQGIVVRNEVTPNQAVRIYNENWELVDECDSSTCGNPYTYATGTGKYFVQVQLFDENGGWLCQADPIEVVVEENGNPCATFCQQAIVEFQSQADIDAFCGCEEITGDVRITGDINDLTPLNGLKKIGGFLAIFETELTDFSGLESLAFIGTDIFVGNNPLLLNLKGLENIPQLGGAFVVDGNPILESLAGTNLQAIHNLNISGNDALIDISNLINIKELGGLSITANKSLPNLEGLNNLVALGDGNTQGGNFSSLVIGGNASINNLDALSNLQLVTENIIVEFNSALSDCCGLAHLVDDDPNNGQAQSNVSLKENPNACNSVEEILANCVGGTPSCDNITLNGKDGKITINNLNAPIEIVKIYDENWNRVFECNADCEDPTIFETSAGKYYVQIQMYTENWEWICGTDNLEVTVKDGGNNCDVICNQDQIILSSQAEVDAFCGCETVAGHLVIGNVNSQEMTDITSLHTLTNLKQVGKDLFIFRTQLTDLQGLNNLESINGSLVIDSNPELPNLAGLDNLRRIELALVLFSHPNLVSLDGIQLDKLSSFGSTNNTSLSNTSALNNFTHLKSLTILGPHPSAILSGFENLTSLGQEVMEGGALSIIDVDNLLNLNSLSNLSKVIGDIVISQNGALSDCCGISHLIDDDPNNGDLEGAITLEDNREGCNSVEEILESCNTPTPPCSDITTTISDLIVQNGAARREVNYKFTTHPNVFTVITLFDRNKTVDYFESVSYPEGTYDFTEILEEGEYAIKIDRSGPQAFADLQCSLPIIFVDVPASPCEDKDGDYLCAYNDCDDNDPSSAISPKITPGFACDDENPATQNDVIQADGCTCAGTPISENPCEDISLSLDENNPGLIYVNGRTSPIQLLTLYDARWNKIWDGTCDKGDPLSTCNAFGVHPPGLYRVYVRMFDENWQYICETDFLEIEIPEPQNSSRSGDFIDESNITLFPNPALNTLNMRTYSLKGKTGSIQIYNTFGQQIQAFPAKEFTEEFESFDVSNYENGLYLMTIKMNNQRVITKRFLVENLK